MTLAMRQPLQEMGRTAARMVLGLIQQLDKPPERVRLNTQLVIRGSCQAFAKRNGLAKRGAVSGATKQRAA